MSENATPEQGSDFTVASAADALMDILPDEGQEDSQESATDEQVEATEEQSEEVEAEESESEASEGQDEVAEEPTAETLIVKVDGEEVEVTLDELKSGYSRTRDYTKKTQELAQQRKAFEAEAQQTLQEREYLRQTIQQFRQALEGEGQEPDWDTLRQTDPIEFTVKATEWRLRQDKIKAAREEEARLAQLNQLQMRQQMQERLVQERDVLLTAIPEWRDAKVASAEKAKILEAGMSMGFTKAELDGITDHRAVMALRKAAKYDELMSKKAAAQPVASTQKVVKPGSKAVKNTPDAKKAAAAATRTGNVKDAAKAIEFLLS